MIKTNGLSVKYNNNEVLKNINLEFSNDRFISIIGPNGSGKTTLLKSLANIVNHSGHVFIDDVKITKINRKTLSKKISYFSQISSLNQEYKVYDTVLLGRYTHLSSFTASYQTNDYEITNKNLELLGIANLKDKYLKELSGGEQQRVFLAQIITQDSDILLLDEPTNHLDLIFQIELLDFINKWAIDNKKIVISVFHDLSLALKYSKRTVLLDKGKVIKDGPTNDVLSSEEIKRVYNLNIKNHMLNTYRKWETI
ncbi:hypothetical protein CI105_02470 [Candidatus Izimaplasma bacterium ZiA1]|uniref:ABC transporter ATP-binding protein n=1 Tax=Candidatus Izimoplasma sp. ZiA1 TaxID=2024899 RepID=UPI000BAA5052|nr:hypothetical protein CI105_02470 [Candidatus Izimaplasma bacterium ZiA1]